MAKIYETEKDVKRDALETQLQSENQQRNFALEMLGMGIGVIATGIAAHMVIPKNIAKGILSSVRENSGTLYAIGGFLLGYGGAGTFRGNLRVKQTQAKLNELGQQEVVTPCHAEDYIKTKTGHAAQISTEQSAPSQFITK